MAYYRAKRFPDGQLRVEAPDRGCELPSRPMYKKSSAFTDQVPVMTSPFRAALTVRFGDVDRAGIVYFPRFLNYVHIALEEYFSKVLEIDYPVMIQKHRLAFPTVHLEMDFIRPLRFGDRVGIEVVPEKLGRTSVTWRYRLFRPDETEPAAVGCQVTVCTHMDSFEKLEIPGWLRERLERGGGAGSELTAVSRRE